VPKTGLGRSAEVDVSSDVGGRWFVLAKLLGEEVSECGMEDMLTKWLLMLKESQGEFCKCELAL
jgi:hypothetical protein